MSKMLHGIREAALVEYRLAASKMGFYLTQSGNEYTGDGEEDERTVINEAEPGLFEELPANVTDVKTFDPKTTTGVYEPFNRECMRGIGAAWGVQYHSLANDLTQVSFSSIRSGTLDERDNWMVLQVWFIENFMQPVFEEWLKMALLTKKIRLGVEQFDKLNTPMWKPKRWQWVDPYKDAQANVLLLEKLLKSRGAIIAEQSHSGDFSDVLAALIHEYEAIVDSPLPLPGAETDTEEPDTDDEE